MTHTRRLINYDVSKNNMDSRIIYGKSVERMICDTLRQEFGWVLIAATSNEDRYEKIDAFRHIEGTKFVPIQIKYRSSRDDILFEVHRFDGKPGYPNGRDYISRAQLYVGLSPEGKSIIVCSIEDLKKDSLEAFHLLIKSNKDRINLKKNNQIVGSAKKCLDPFSKVEKVLYFGYKEYYITETYNLRNKIIKITNT